MRVRILVSLLLSGCAQSTASPLGPREPTVADSFWDHWGDGRAEVAGYALTQPRYGEDRSGEAVLIFVTEDFDEQARVKSDRGGPGTVPVLKLNEARDFQTGLYDYNAMTSVFVPLAGDLPAGTPAKVSLSMQEWCGHAFDQLVVRGSGVTRALHSYFEGEADQVGPVELPPEALYEDALPVLARSIVGAPQSWSGPVVPRLLDLRLHHRPLTTEEGTLSIGEPTEQTVPAGTFVVRPVVLTRGAHTTTHWVEVEAPHRIVGWERADGERAVLTGSLRTAYWNRSGEGDEALREQLGLPSRPWPRHP